MLNEFERRFIEVVQNDLDLRRVWHDLGATQEPEYFGYSLQVGSAASPLINGVTQQGFITVQADSWFVISYISTAVILPAGSTSGDVYMFTPSDNILLQVTDTGAGQELYNLPSGYVGFPSILTTGTPTQNTAGVPYVFPTPRLVPPNTNIKVEFTQFGFTGGSNPQPIGAYIMLNGARIPV